MKENHEMILREITDELELLAISGGEGGSGDWATGAQTVWGAVVGAVAGSYGLSCSWPAPFYGGGESAVPAGGGTCTGGGGYNMTMEEFCRMKGMTGNCW